MAARADRVQVRRIYDPPERDDGQRVLVDRLWPRGVRKADAHFDEWCKEIAPSTELRKWYGHVPDRYSVFARRYRDELKDAEHADSLAHLRELAARGRLTALVTARGPGFRSATVVARLVRG